MHAFAFSLILRLFDTIHFFAFSTPTFARAIQVGSFHVSSIFSHFLHDHFSLHFHRARGVCVHFSIVGRYAFVATTPSFCAGRSHSTSVHSFRPLAHLRCIIRYCVPGLRALMTSFCTSLRRTFVHFAMRTSVRCFLHVCIFSLPYVR